MHQFIILFCSFITIVNTARLISYRPNDYFNITNRNIYWSFGYTDPTDHLSFQPYSSYVNSVYGNPIYSNLQVATMSGFSQWCTSTTLGGLNYVNNGCIGMNSNNKTDIDFQNEFYLKPGQLVFHPGFNNAHACIRFTVPLAGFYDVEGVFFSPGPPNAPNGNATTDIHLSINNVELRSLWINQNSGMLIFRQIYLNVGDFVQFEIGWGQNKNYYFDTTAANITIVAYS
ncbi:hypothetical protein I4U23_017220 [Adineta vaga]|nr:hypothetical protein I4U23_017220 [Adineta vaga]